VKKTEICMGLAVLFIFGIGLLNPPEDVIQYLILGFSAFNMAYNIIADEER